MRGLRIGVDVGGTNTDAVILKGKNIRASVKRPTTADISSGIKDAIASLLVETGIGASEVEAVMIGTTHFTNAFIQASELARVASLRVGFPAARGVSPFSSWPARMRQAVEGHSAMIRGGFQYDGRLIGSFDENAVKEEAAKIRDRGIEEVAVSCVFAQVNDEHERLASEILTDLIPGVSVTLSSEVGRTGLLERENAAIMNASLRPLARHVAQAFRTALLELGIVAPFFVSQNDGTLMSAALMQRYPVLTFAAGPTNSLRGAYFLTERADALVLDIGGTTSDIGVLVGGFPRQSSISVDIGGIRTNFRTPDILSVGLGGGSRVRTGGDVSIGPDSVGFRLTEEAIVFGGKTMTATDIAVASGYADVGDAQAVKHIDPDLIEAGVIELHRILADGIDRMKTSAAGVPLILVGGGSILVDRPLPGVSEIIRPPDAGVANAVGAAIGQVSGEVDRIYNCNEGNRQYALDHAREMATKSAVLAGGAPDSVTVSLLEDIPLQYLPDGARRVVCRTLADLVIVGDGRAQ